MYNFTTNNIEFMLFIKYRADKQNTKTNDYNSWVFNLTESDKKEILGYVDGGYNVVIALLCGVKGLAESEIAILDKDQINKIINLKKTSITVSRKKNEHAFRISLGGGRDNSMQVKNNRFDELF